MRSTGLTKRLVCAAVVLMGVALIEPPSAHAAQGDCGQPLSTGSAPKASDALFVLQAAVGVSSCDACLCDVDNSGGTTPVTASDALRVLKRAVDATIVLLCPPCSGSTSCFDQQAPTCNGDCPVGLTCGEDPFDPGFCECLNACEASSAPTCGGSCAAEGDPSLVCQVLGVSTDGGPIENLCTCAPSFVQLCTEASAPTCEGLCQPGAVCTSGSGGCSCQLLPLQPPCASASAPTCAGVCDDGFICENGSGGCGCVAFGAQTETCFDVDVPVCGGVCAFGDFCGMDILGVCECFTQCELSVAPACGGACPDAGSSCVIQTLHLAGKTLDICACD